MTKAIEIKKGLVTTIAEKLEKSVSCIVVDYKGLKVEEVTELRSKFREAGIDYKVYKNTLVRRAAAEVGNMAQFDDVNLVGTNAIAFGYEDPVAPAKIVNDFAKTHPKIELKMGFVEGEFYDAENIKKLAEIPSRDELIAKLLGSLKAPVSNFVYLVDAIAKKQEA